ncbi:type II toxin-antitoxin system Phd/YefM family antitoxin [Levilactobacillus brevis]|nr:type II toxin-antitoxin system Phd/YefM family antitoxin [Levilactobacillus brevis]
MKHYSPIARQQDFQQVLTAVHQLQETIMITPTDSEDEHAAVIMPKREWEAARELAFLQRPSRPNPQLQHLTLIKWNGVKPAIIALFGRMKRSRK